MSQPLDLYIGLPMWSHEHWQQSLYGVRTPTQDRLNCYSQIFNTVEGNTTFYALPKSSTVLRWADLVDQNFRFTFKFPQTITHQNQLAHCQNELREFFSRMEPVSHQVGSWMLQLPPSFGPEYLARLEQFFEGIPPDIPLSVEVRHREFFAKGEAEQRLNQLLLQRQIDRVMIDTRAIFANQPESALLADARQKKPQLPVHALATGKRPLIRFIGSSNLRFNQRFFQPWLSKISYWIEQGQTPYLMVHTPDNIEAPKLAVMLYHWLNEHWLQQHSMPLKPQPTLLPVVDDYQLTFSID